MRTTIVAVCAAILVVFAVVIGINWKQIAGTSDGKEATSTEATATEVTSTEATSAEAASTETASAQNGQDTTVGTVLDMTQTATDYGTQIGNDLKAFERDEAFFDPEQTDMEELMETASKRLSLMVTSVERDLRVYVVDIFGEPVTGQPFVVTLSGEDEYKDLDQDGMIYIADLSPGEYEVALEDAGEYLAPFETTKVRVQDQVNFRPLADISYMLHSEDEINALLEDTGESDALNEGDEEASVDTMDASAHWGIDVSKWNKEIDWKQVAESGVEFVIIRCGYRGSSSGYLVEDPYFEQNIRGAKEAGLQVGVYFFTQAIDVTEAVEEASIALTLCAEYELDYPIFIDTEGAGGNGRADSLDAVTRTEVCDAFCRTVESSGYRAGVYASCNWFNNNLISDGLGHHYIWLAEYRKVPQYSGKYDMWQYTSKGSVAGIDGNVDLNIGYID